MSMTADLPRFELSGFAWKAAKAAFGGAIFIAMCLPVAFPAKVANSAAAREVAMGSQQPPATTKAVAPGAKAKAASPAKAAAADLPAKKPQPKTATNTQWTLALR